MDDHKTNTPLADDQHQQCIPDVIKFVLNEVLDEVKDEIIKEARIPKRLWVRISYNEAIEQPKYKNDNRFEPVTFGADNCRAQWNNNYCFINGDQPEFSKSSEASSVTSNINNILPKGFSSKQDIYCLNSIADKTTSSTFFQVEPVTSDTNNRIEWNNNAEDEQLIDLTQPEIATT
ncbi:unnamed protein product [Leptidea sinapis]|uniref:Uncharacterized protein n=1 Tax=Leptidea sinapis TaxID=189913 RepID=A0A5E4QCJ3_9NEOP|nr:unnamed protein product [Leptidea sinapis]